jgi:hypothetical protein
VAFNGSFNLDLPYSPSRRSCRHSYGVESLDAYVFALAAATPLAVPLGAQAFGRISGPALDYAREHSLSGFGTKSPLATPNLTVADHPLHNSHRSLDFVKRSIPKHSRKFPPCVSKLLYVNSTTPTQCTRFNKPFGSRFCSRFLHTLRRQLFPWILPHLLAFLFLLLVSFVDRSLRQACAKLELIDPSTF